MDTNHIPQYQTYQHRGNGLAVAALTLGIIGAFFGLIPFTCFHAWILGTLALSFGLVGRGKKYMGYRRKMATAGAVLGVICLALGVIGLVIVGNAVEDLDKCFDSIGTADTSDDDNCD